MSGAYDGCSRLTIMYFCFGLVLPRGKSLIECVLAWKRTPWAFLSSRLSSVKIHFVLHFSLASLLKSGRSQSRNPRILFHTSTVIVLRELSGAFASFKYEKATAFVDFGLNRWIECGLVEMGLVLDLVWVMCSMLTIAWPNTLESHLWAIQASWYAWSCILPHLCDFDTGSFIPNWAAALVHHWCALLDVDTGSSIGLLRTVFVGGFCEDNIDSATSIALWRADRSCINLSSSDVRARASLCFSSSATSCRRRLLEGLSCSRAKALSWKSSVVAIGSSSMAVELLKSLISETRAWVWDGVREVRWKSNISLGWIL